MTTTRINIKPHLAEFMSKKYEVDDETYIRINRNDDLYHILYDLLQRKSENINQEPAAGNLEIALPSKSLGKRPEFFNYLSVRSQKIIENKIDADFKKEMHLFVDDMITNFDMSIKDAVYVFIEKYDLSISFDTLIKDYYRHRRDIGRRRKKTRNYIKAK